MLFIPAILGAFDLQGLLDPVRAMTNKALDMVPNVAAALAIGFVGWVVAKVLRGLVTNLLAAAGADRINESVGLAGVGAAASLGAFGTLVFIFVFVPTLIAALDALKIEAISRPATDMLEIILNAVPHIIAAAMILIITYYVARFAAALVTKLLNSVGLDALPDKLGLTHFRGSLLPSVIRA